MQKQILLFFVFFLGLQLNAQQLNWAFNAGDENNDDSAHAITRDASGNIYITGKFQGTTDFDPSSSTHNLTSNGDDDIFIAKYNSSGDIQWAFNIGGTEDDEGWDITLDASSNVYVTGNFFGTNVDFDPSANTNALSTNNFSNELFVAKYNSNGDYQWAFNIGKVSSTSGLGIITDASSNVLVTGYFSDTDVDFDPGPSTNNLSSNGNVDFFLAKYDTNGEYQWAFNAGDNDGERGYDIVLDASSNIYITGSFQFTVDFDPSANNNSITSNGSQDIFVVKYNSNGDYQWAFNIGSSTTDIGYGIDVDASSNVYITGRFSESNIDFDPGPNVNALSSNGSVDIFVAKYNTNGDYQWAFNIGGAFSDIGRNIAVDASSNVYVTGYFQLANVDFDPSGNTNTLSSNGSGDIYLAKYDSNGNYIGAFSVGENSLDTGFDILVDNNEQIYLTGDFGDTNVDFDPDPNVTANLSSNGDKDIFTAFYKSTALPVELIDFNAFSVDNNVQLSWRTASEINNKGFQIEWSKDSRTWKSIGFAEGAGTSFEKQTYSFTHENPTFGLNYYRLKQTDHDESFEYSKVISVDFRNLGHLKDIKITPNPTQNGSFTLYLPETDLETAHLEIYNAVGQIVLGKEITKQQTVLNIQNFQKGNYWLLVNVNGHTQVKKLILQ